MIASVISGYQTNRAVGVNQQRQDRYEDQRDSPVLHEVEAPVQQPRNDHHGRKLGEITTCEPVGEHVVREEESHGSDRVQQTAVGHQRECLTHSVGPDHQKQGDADDQRLLECAAKKDEDEAGHIEERLMVEEQHRCAESESIGTRPDREEVEVPEVGGIDRNKDQLVVERRSDRPARTTADERQDQRRRAENDDGVGNFVDPLSPED